MNEINERISKIIETRNERIKLQKFYLTLAFFSFFIASFISLIDRDFGRLILSVTIISIIIFLLNAIVWTLGLALFENFFSSKKPASKSKK